jgi:uncharacterized membrane protein
MAAPEPQSQSAATESKGFGPVAIIGIVVVSLGIVFGVAGAAWWMFRDRTDKGAANTHKMMTERIKELEKQKEVAVRLNAEMQKGGEFGKRLQERVRGGEDPDKAAAAVRKELEEEIKKEIEAEEKTKK